MYLAKHGHEATPAVALGDGNDLLAVSAPLHVLRWEVKLPADAMHVLDAQAERGDLAAAARAGPNRLAPAEFIQPDWRDHDR
jgi:hypothetical protein